VADPWVFRVIGTDTRLGAAGSEAMLLPVPARWYGIVDGRPALIAAVVSRELRELSDAGAASVGEQLHHADWVITADPAQIRQVGQDTDHPGCEQCRAGTVKALAWLAAHPGGEVAAGVLHWLRQDPP
jgi:hypothetical protein